ncbi:9977_t:CDS:1, partial [Funneliformis geosporum]
INIEILKNSISRIFNRHNVNVNGFVKKKQIQLPCKKCHSGMLP